MLSHHFVSPLWLILCDLNLSSLTISICILTCVTWTFYSFWMAFTCYVRYLIWSIVDLFDQDFHCSRSIYSLHLSQFIVSHQDWRGSCSFLCYFRHPNLLRRALIWMDKVRTFMMNEWNLLICNLNFSCLAFLSRNRLWQSENALTLMKHIA